MKVFILGGDGFCGWPTALHLSDARPRRGHRRQPVPPRKIDIELEVGSR